jgi:hypothetical protein
MNLKGYGRKRSWPNLRYYPEIYLEGLRKTTKNSGYPVPGPRFETWIFRIRARVLDSNTIEIFYYVINSVI